MKGLNTLAEALRLEDFPADKHDIAYAVGDLELQDSHGRQVAVRDILDRIDQEEFRSAEEAVRAIRAHVDKPAERAA